MQTRDDSELLWLGFRGFVLVAIAGILYPLAIAAWAGGWPLLLGALGCLEWVLFVVVLLFVLALVAGWTGAAVWSGVSFVAERVDARIQTRAEARRRRTQQGADMVPAAAPKGRGSEPESA